MNKPDLKRGPNQKPAREQPKSSNDNQIEEKPPARGSGGRGIVNKPASRNMKEPRRLLCALRIEIDFEKHEDLNIYEGDDFRFRVQRFVEKFNLADDAVD